MLIAIAHRAAPRHHREAPATLLNLSGISGKNSRMLQYPEWGGVPSAPDASQASRRD